MDDVETDGAVTHNHSNLEIVIHALDVVMELTGRGDAHALSVMLRIAADTGSRLTSVAEGVLAGRYDAAIDGDV